MELNISKTIIFIFRGDISKDYVIVVLCITCIYVMLLHDVRVVQVIKESVLFCSVIVRKQHALPSICGHLRTQNIMSSSRCTDLFQRWQCRWGLSLSEVQQ